MPRKKLVAKISPAESAQKVWLAGLGALALAEDEGSKLFKTLVAKGRERADVADLPRRTVAEAKDRLGTTFTKLERGFDERVQNVLHRIGVPTRDEIESLTKRVEALTQALSKAKPADRRRRAPQGKTPAGA